jgi:hypothetical protein
MALFTGKHLWSMPALRWAAAVIALAMASSGCAEQLTGGIGCSMCRTPAAVKPATPTIITQGKFFATGDMLTPRNGHIATLLDDGRVLIAGGEAPEPVGIMGQFAQLRSAEIYDPEKRKFEATDSMRSARQALAAVLLRDGNVLFVGGPDAEIYDARRGRFVPTGNPIDEITSPLAVMLKDGNVLVCGVRGTSCEIYFSKVGKFRETSHTHGGGTINPILLPDGRVLIGVRYMDYYYPGFYFEIFDPETETFRVLPGQHSSLGFAIRLDDGRIFLGSEFFDPVTDTFTNADGFPKGNSVTLLQSGKLLLAGGSSTCNAPTSPQGGPRLGSGIAAAVVWACLPPPPTAQAWLYDTQTQTQVEIEDMNVARRGQTATRLKDGSVLLAGGRSTEAILSSAEIYVP